MHTAEVLPKLCQMPRSTVDTLALDSPMYSRQERSDAIFSRHDSPVWDHDSSLLTSWRSAHPNHINMDSRAGTKDEESKRFMEPSPQDR